MNFYEIIGFIAAALTTTAFLPQVIKSFLTKKTKDLSFGLLILQSSGNFLWVLYGLTIASWPLIIANALTFLLVFSLLVLKSKNRKNFDDDKS